MSTATITQWWVFPKDAQTNETISEALTGLYSRECASESVECADGKSRDMWKVSDHTFVSRMARSKKNGMKIDFQIFRSTGSGKPAEWKFENKPKISVAKIKAESDKKKIKLAATMPAHRKH